MTKMSSLTVVGSGIRFMSHLTIEAKAVIEAADKILYLVNDPAMRAWLLARHPEAESLEKAYYDYPKRASAYQAMTRTILQALECGRHICVVLEGHPGVFARPALEAVIQARLAGHTAVMLPGISADAYLFSELQIDPGSAGCQSYEATDFLIHRRAFDGCSHLLLWQVSMIGILTRHDAHDHRRGTQLLVERLGEVYPDSHAVTLFEGSQYPHIASRIEKCPLKNLANAGISGMTTLYIPPARKPPTDMRMLQQLGIMEVHAKTDV
ncbi:hypothetical protein AQUSIP_04830 [Aquicella siphonis]|uniref:Tetrapyrrole methylase domain-containing protein n=1 Tax=Aquicella siphonis TaxID=254247 RepID=A0A5E4PFS9_9COXI|nr:SAM-dependent methyltransferase [Aquicella siphonis]VVC75196.1 hypothetical protein AQUSIP_04830 [Aquicella siphonis]